MRSQVWGVCMCKDEADVIEPVVRQLFAQGIDGCLVADNMSTDNTRAILIRLSREFSLTVLQDAEVRYLQSQKMTNLANAAHALGAEWIIPFDADEMFVSEGAPVAEQLRRRRDSLDVLSIRMKNYVATAKDNPSDPNPLTREQWRQPGFNRLNKVVVRWQAGMTLAPGNHLVGMNGHNLQSSEPASITICHFQNRSPEHFIRKIRNEAKAYANAGLPEGVGYWHKFGHLTDSEIRAWWRKDYFVADPAAAGLVHEPAPYLAREAVPA